MVPQTETAIKVRMKTSIEEIRITFSPEEAVAALRTMRRSGLKNPKDHHIVEIGRLSLIVIPFLFLIFEKISESIFLAILGGYFVHRLYDRYVKPTVLTFFGPNEFLKQKNGTAELILSPDGLRGVGPTKELFLSWSHVAVSKLKNGIVFRIAPEQSTPIIEDWIPSGWTVESVNDQIIDWKNAQEYS